jgi:hypothetical protein
MQGVVEDSEGSGGGKTGFASEGDACRDDKDVLLGVKEDLPKDGLHNALTIWRLGYVMVPYSM